METLYIYIILIFIILIAKYYRNTYEGFDTKMYRLGDMITNRGGGRERKGFGFDYHIKHLKDKGCEFMTVKQYIAQSN